MKLKLILITLLGMLSSLSFAETVMTQKLVPPMPSPEYMNYQVKVTALRADKLDSSTNDLKRKTMYLNRYDNNGFTLPQMVSVKEVGVNYISSESNINSKGLVDLGMELNVSPLTMIENKDKIEYSSLVVVKVKDIKKFGFVYFKEEVHFENNIPVIMNVKNSLGDNTTIELSLIEK